VSFTTVQSLMGSGDALQKIFYGSMEDFSEIDGCLRGLNEGKTHELDFLRYL